MKAISRIGIKLIVVSTSLWLSSSYLHSARLADNIVLNKTSHDFGKYKFESKNLILKTKFILHNTGKTKISIKDVYTSCGCTTAHFKEREILPNAKIEVPVELRAVEVHGKKTEVCVLKLSDDSLIKLPVHVDILLDVQILPKVLYFVYSPTGEPISQNEFFVVQRLQDRTCKDVVSIPDTKNLHFEISKVEAIEPKNGEESYARKFYVKANLKKTANREGKDEILVTLDGTVTKSEIIFKRLPSAYAVNTTIKATKNNEGYFFIAKVKSLTEIGNLAVKSQFITGSDTIEVVSSKLMAQESGYRVYDVNFILKNYDKKSEFEVHNIEMKLNGDKNESTELVTFKVIL